VPIALALTVTIFLMNNDNAKRSVDVQAVEPQYASLEELVKSSDLVVVARVTQVADGRTVAAGSGERSAIRTQLVTLQVGDVLDGKAEQSITLEQEHALGDGTPITVNGVAPLKPNDEALLFLVKSTDEAAPYFAVANAQGRYVVSGPQRNQLTPAGNDALSQRLAALGPYTLRCNVLSVGDTGRFCDEANLPADDLTSIPTR
jgi:hypothetical protein